MSLSQLKKQSEALVAVKAKLRAMGQDEKNFCIVPFTTIILEPDGQVGVCRHKGSDFPIGYIQKNTIAEIWNSAKVQQWRKEFLEGKPQICATEVRHQHCHQCTENNKLLDYIELREVQTQPILKLTANFNGKCNLQCKMCDIWMKPNGLYNDENFWTPAKKDIFPFLKEIDMLSGEPFIQPDTYRLMDEVSAINPDCQWMITTNMHWKFTDIIEAKLDKIKIKNLIMSVDSLIPEVYHKIRKPGNLEFVLQNIENMFAYQERRIQKGLEGFKFILNCTIQPDNWSEIENVINYCDSKKISPIITFAYQPESCSLLGLPETERISILRTLATTLSGYHLVRSMRVIMPLYDSLPAIDKAEMLFLMKDKLEGFSNDLDYDPT